MSLKLAKGPLFAALAVLAVAGIVFGAKSFAPEFAIVGLSMAEYGDLFAIALAVFALMLGALSFVMAKPVAKAPKVKKSKKNQDEEAPLDLLDDSPMEDDDTPELDEKAKAKLEAAKAKKAKAEAKKAAAEKRREEREAAKAAKEAEKKAKAEAKNNPVDNVDLIDDGLEMITEDESTDAPAPVRPEVKDEASEETPADEIVEVAVTEDEMLEESGPAAKKLSPAEKRAERAAKREAAKRAREEERFRRQAEKEAAKAAKAAAKAEKKGLEEEDSYDMLNDGEILAATEADEEMILPEVDDDAKVDDNAVSVEEESEEVVDESPEDSEESEKAESENEDVVEVEDSADEEVVVAEDSAEETEELEEPAENNNVDEEKLAHELAAPKLNLDPKWVTEAFNDDRFVVPFSSRVIQDERDAKMDALLERMDTILERLDKVEEANSPQKGKSAKSAKSDS